MANELATAYVSLVPTAKGIGSNIARELAPVEGHASQAGDKAGRSFGTKFASGFKAIGVGTAIVGGLALAGAVTFGKQALDAASDLNESVSKVNVVFGQNANEIMGWSSTAAQGLGMSQQKALEAAGTFGNLFSAMKIGQPAAVEMSKGIIGLSADLASFNNANPEDVLIALKAGLVGETEPLRRFGINLNAARIEAKAMEMGLAATKGELTSGAKAQAAYALIMEDSTLAQGDFARTSDGLANKQRIAAAQFEDMTAKIGNALLPAMTALMGFISSTIIPGLERFGSMVAEIAGPILSEIVGGIQAFIAAFKAGDGDITSSGMAGVFERVGLIAREIADTMRNVLGTAISFVVDNFRTIATVAGVVVGALVAYKVIMAAIKIAQIAWTLATTAWTVVTNAGAIAQWALNAALAANPIGLVVIAIMALVGAAVLAYTKIDWFRNIVDTAWDAIQAVISWAWNNVIQPIWTAISFYISNILIPYVQLLWTVYSTAFKIIVAVIEWAWNTIIRPIWDAIYAHITEILIPILQTLWGIAQAVWQGIQAAISIAWGIIQGIWGNMRTGIDILVGVFNVIRSVAQTVWNAISSAVSTAWNAISVVFGYIKGGIDTLAGAWTAIKDGVSSAFTGLADLIKAPFSSAFSFIKSLWNNTVGGFGFDVPDWIPGIGGKSFKIPEMHTGGWVPGAPGSEMLAVLQAGEYVVPADEAARSGPYAPGGRGPAIGQLHLHEVRDVHAAGDYVAWKVRTA
jgi:phage-related protein